MISRLRDLFRAWMDHDGKLHVPKDVHAEFDLMLDQLPVGRLSVNAGKWRFQYSEEFKRHVDLRPIVEFPQIEKTYESDELWPFFMMRIPSLKQSSINEIVKSEHIDETDELQLLRRFGKRTISNPFWLVEILPPSRQ